MISTHHSQAKWWIQLINQFTLLSSYIVCHALVSGHKGHFYFHYIGIIILDGKGCLCIIYNLSKVLGTSFQVKGKAKFFIVKHGLELLQGNNVCGKYYIFDMQKNNNWLALLINCTIFPAFYCVSVTICHTNRRWPKSTFHSILVQSFHQKILI